MAISAVGERYSAMSDFSFIPVQTVRRIHSDEVAFTMPEELSIERKEASSQKSSEFSSQKGTDATGIVLSDEMRNFLAQMPVSASSQSPDSEDLTQDSEAFSEKTVSEKVDEITADQSEGTALSTGAILNTVGLLMSTNPVAQQESVTSSHIALHENPLYTQSVQTPQAVSSIEQKPQQDAQGGQSSSDTGQEPQNPYSMQNRFAEHALRAYNSVQTQGFVRTY